MEASDFLTLSWRDAEIDQFIGYVGILEIYNEPMAKPVQDYLVEVLGLDLPVSDHARSETIPL